MSEVLSAFRPRPKILVVEDSPALQAILTNAVLEVPGLDLAGVVDTAVEALAAFELHRPDFVILDLVLRAGSGLDVLHRIKQRAPECRVLIFTAHDGVPFRTRCLAAGVDSFFSKNTQHQELMQHLRNLGGEAPAVRPKTGSSEPMPSPANP